MKRVVLIEPDDDCREIFGTVLRAHGHHVTACGDAEAGIDMVQRLRPDIIVSEVFERTATGWALLDRFSGDESTRRIPVLVVSSHALPEDADRARRSGARLFLTKPLTARQLLAGISQVFRVG